MSQLCPNVIGAVRQMDGLGADFALDAPAGADGCARLRLLLDLSIVSVRHGVDQ